MSAVRQDEHAGEPLGRVGLILMTVSWAAVLGRALGLSSDPDLRLAYIVGMTAFLALLVVVLVRRPRVSPVLHVVLAAQVGIMLVLLSLDPAHDFVTALLVLECYEAAVVLRDSARLVWVALLVTTIGCSLVLEIGPLHGLALALVPMAAGVVLAMFAVVGQELELARATSARMVTDLETARERLQDYAGQVDELAAIEQRARLAGDLQASVSGTLTEVLDASAGARARLGDRGAIAGTGEGATVADQLERLETLTHEALAQMRRIIAELRPPAAAVAPAAPGAAPSDTSPAPAPSGERPGS